MGKAGRRKILGQGRYLRLVDEGGWEYSERVGSTGVVAMVALTAGRELVLVEQRRRALRRRVLELPAGLVGDAQGRRRESPLSAARRELEEETGFSAARWRLLGPGPSAPGSSNTLMHLYLATGLRRSGKGGGDAHEDITVHCVPLAVCEAFLRRMRRRGRLVDPKVYAGLYFAAKVRR